MMTLSLQTINLLFLHLTLETLEKFIEFVSISIIFL
jgi:hypothetical protein